MERRNGVRFGVSSVEAAGVDELEEGLVVEKLGKRMFWVRVGKLISSSLLSSSARMVETRKSADRISYRSPWLLGDDLEREKYFGCQIGRFISKGLIRRKRNGG